MKISKHIEAKDDIIKYVIAKYKELKKGFTRTKRLSLKKAKMVRGLHKIEDKMLAFEKRLEKIKNRVAKERGHKSNERDTSFTQESGYGNKGD